MIKGIIFFEQGGVQVIGEVSSFAGILATIDSVVPQMQEQEKARVVSRLSDEELKQILEERAKQPKTE